MPYVRCPQVIRLMITAQVVIDVAGSFISRQQIGGFELIA